MPGVDALDLVNWIPQNYGVRCRKGYSEWAVGMSGGVGTIMQYQTDRQALASYRLFATTDNNIYDVTASTNAPASVLTLSGAPGFGRFAHTMFTNTAGGFLAACSHEGGYFTYDGTAWVKRVAGTSPGQINGIDPDNLVFVVSFKKRLWFVQRGSTNAWYGATDQITGTLTVFPLGSFVKHGGKLAFITTWTIDAGEGIDDLLVFVFENGDVLIYKGTDPASSSTFAIQGSWYIGAVPVGRRGFCNYGGDVLIASELGLQPLSYVTRGAQSLLRASSVDYLGKIQPRMSELLSQSSLFNGWDLILHAKENLLIVQVPPGATNENTQYALYTNTNAWTRFAGIPMRCSTVANNQFWFGTDDGKVCLGFDRFFDAVPYGSAIGNGILGTIQMSYSYFGMSGRNKHFLMVRPIFLANGKPGVAASMVADFAPYVAAGVPVYSSGDGSLFDVASWDSAVWGGSLSVYQDWYGAEALGFTGSLNLTTACVGDTFLATIDYLFEYGGPF